MTRINNKKLELGEFQKKVIEEMKKLGYNWDGGSGYTNSIYFINDKGNDTVRVSDHMKGSGYINANHHIYYEIEYETDEMKNVIESYVDEIFLEEAIKEAKLIKAKIEQELEEFEKSLKGKSKEGICFECPKNAKLYLCENCEEENYMCVECLKEHKKQDNRDFYDE